MILHIPHDAKPVEMQNSVAWLDADGILYSVPKENSNPAATVQEIKTDMEKLRELVGDNKVCMIIEGSRRGSNLPKEQRDLLATGMNSVAKAIAIVTSSPLSRMAANLFFSFKPPGYPYKMFSNEREAREWIKRFL